MASPRRRAKRALDVVVRAADGAVPARASVALHSSPDLDDSIVALLRGRPDDVDVTVLAGSPASARRRARALGLPGLRIVPRRSRRGVLAYLRASVLVSTHGMYGAGRRGRGKTVVGLWHGEFGKLIGPFVGEPARHFDWVPVSSSLSRSLRSAEFALDPAHIHVVGSPRQRLLAATDGVSADLVDRLGGRRVVVWAPTYRTSTSGQVRSDGDPELLAREVPLDDPELVALLERHHATLWYRPHPVSGTDVEGLASPGVRRATNDDLEHLGLTFYEMLAVTDCFVTDYSSLWVDFLLADRPMIAFCPDLDAYRRTRGLALEPHEQWVPGPVVGTREAFLAALDRALTDPTADAVDRARVRALLHTAGDTDPVAATWEHVRSVLPPG